jgi:hypothetical protein
VHVVFDLIPMARYSSSVNSPFSESKKHIRLSSISSCFVTLGGVYGLNFTFIYFFLSVYWVSQIIQALLLLGSVWEL